MTTSRPICLVSCFLPPDDAQRRCWQWLADELQARGWEMALLTSASPWEFDVPAIHVPFSLREFAALADGVPSGRGLFNDAEAECLAERDRLWINADRDPGTDVWANVRSCERFLSDLIDGLRPACGFVWGGTLPQSAILRAVLRDRNIPAFVLERGLLPGTLMVEEAGLNADSLLNLDPGYAESILEAADPARYENLRRYFVGSVAQKYAQPQYREAEAERVRLGLTGRRVVTFFGQDDVASGLVPRDRTAERYAPMYVSTADALAALSDALASEPGVTLLFKPHPNDHADYRRLREQDNIRVVGDAHPHTLFELSDAIAVMTSTIQYEALWHDVPVVLMAHSALKDKGIAYEVDDRRTLAGTLRDALERRQYAHRRERARRFLISLSGHFLIGTQTDVPTRMKIPQLAEFIADVGRTAEAGERGATAVPSPVRHVGGSRGARRTLASFESQLKVRDGERYRKRDNISAALRAYKEALERDPDSVEACLGIGRLLSVVGQGRLARECLQKAVNLAHDHSEAAAEARSLLQRLEAPPGVPPEASGQAGAEIEIETARVRLSDETVSEPVTELSTIGSGGPQPRVRVAIFSFALEGSMPAVLRLSGALGVTAEGIVPVWGCFEAEGRFYVDEQVLDDADVVVLQGGFAASEPMQGHLRAIFNAGKPVIVDVDAWHPELEAADSGAGTTDPRGLNLWEALEHAVLVTVPNEELRNIHGDLLSGAHVMRSRIDPGIWVPGRGDNHAGVNVGLLIDGESKTQSESVAPLIQSTGTRYGSDVTFHIIGGDRDDWCLPHCRHHERPVDQRALARLLGRIGIDAAIVPLDSAAACSVHGEAQWLIWSALGVPAVYPCHGPYPGRVADGVSGCLVSSVVDDWVKALWSLIEDGVARAEMGAAARAAIESDYAADSARDSGDILREATTRPAGDEPGTVSAGAWYRKWVERHRLTDADRRHMAHSLTAQARRDPAVHVFIVADREGDGDGLASTMASAAGLLYRNLNITVISHDAPGTTPATCRMDWKAVAPEADAFDELQGAIAASSADWIAVLQAGDRVSPGFLYECMEYAVENPRWHALYVDEDRTAPDGARALPCFKPDLNMELLRAMPYVGAACLVRRESLLEIGGTGECALVWATDVVLRLADRFGEDCIGHVPRMLFHRDAQRAARAAGPGVEDGLRRVVGAHLRRRGIDARLESGPVSGTLRVEYALDHRPKVSIIVPTRDRLDLLEPCIESLLGETRYPDYEVLIVDNQSSDPATMAYLDTIRERDPRVRVLPYRKAYNFSAINNYAARESTGEYLVLLNNDTVITRPDWLERMMSYACRPETGIVGAKLLFPNGRVQHAGVCVGMSSVADHPMLNFGGTESGYMNRAVLPQELSAVTAACLLMRKAVYEEVGGLDAERFKVLFNDVDLCLKVRERGYKVIWTPQAQLVHHGSGSLDRIRRNPEVEARNRREGRSLLEKWLPVVVNDPAYNPNLRLQGFDLRPEVEVDAPWDPRIETRPRTAGFGFGSEGSWRYRVCMPLQALRDSGMVVSTLLPKHRDRIRVPSIPELLRMNPDVLLMHNTVHDIHLEALGDYRKYWKGMVVFGQDDLISALPETNPFYNTVYKDFRARAERCIALSDRLMVTTEAIADEYRGVANDIRIVPNYLDGRHWLGLDPQRGQGPRPRVGWAGAGQHLGDLELLEEVVVETANEVDWVFFGMCPDSIRPFATEVHPAVPFEDYAVRLASLNLDLAVAPLEINRFNEAKSNLRLLEYGALGWPVVASNIEPFRGAPVKRVENRAHAWIEAIRERVHDPDAAREEGEQLRNWVIRHWMLEDHAEEWATALSVGNVIPEGVVVDRSNG